MFEEPRIYRKPGEARPWHIPLWDPTWIQEAKGFEKEELHKTIVAMRHWDEAAKIKGKDVPTLESYRDLLEKNIR